MRLLACVMPMIFLSACAATAQKSNISPESVPVLDFHSDIINRAMNEDVDLMNAPDWAWSTIPQLENGHVTDQVYSIWVNSRDVTGLDATQRALRMIDFLKQQCRKYPEHLGIATNMQEAEKLHAEGKIAGFLWIEGGVPINNDLAFLRSFYDLGVRGMTLTWMNNLDWAGASTDRENPGKGLTDFGREVVREMNRLGMVVDLSHCSDQTFWDAIEITTQPVVLSHSGCKALSDHPRNVGDDILKALGENGGVIGIVAYPSYLDTEFENKWDNYVDQHEEEIEKFKADYIAKRKQETGEEPHRREVSQARNNYIRSMFPEELDVTLGDYLDHIEHAMNVAGWQHVSLGSDFDGIWILPKGLNDASDWQLVAEGLRQRGHSEEVIRGIMGDNARRVFRQVMK